MNKEMILVGFTTLLVTIYSVVYYIMIVRSKLKEDILDLKIRNNKLQLKNNQLSNKSNILFYDNRENWKELQKYKSLLDTAIKELKLQYSEENKELMPENIKRYMIKENLYGKGGELEDLAHLEGIKCRTPASEEFKIKDEFQPTQEQIAEAEAWLKENTSKYKELKKMKSKGSV